MAHYYSKTGEAVFEVPNVKSGGMRPTRITDVKKLGLLVSVTTLFEVLAKDALDTWKHKQITGAAFLTQPKPGEFPEAYHARIMETAFKQVGDAADMGTRIHKAIEQHFQGYIYDPALKVYVEAVDKWKKENGLEFIEQELRLVNLEYGYAGTTDVYFKREDSFGILDFKSRKTTPGKPVEAYETQPMQVGAYLKARNGEIKDTDIGCNLYISTTEPGRVDAVWYDAKRLRREWEAFTHVIALWEWKNGYSARQQKSTDLSSAA